MSRYKIYTDGGSRGNPGPSGAGGVIYSPEDKVIKEITKYVGIGTNNYAEYQGIILSLRAAIEMEITDVDVFMDSRLVVEQVKGSWKCNSEHLLHYRDEVKHLFTKFNSWTINYVPRRLNIHADRLAKAASFQNIYPPPN